MIPKVFFSNNSLKKPFPLRWLSRGALGSHTCNSDAYISVLGRIAHGKLQNTGCWLGKLVSMSMSQNLLLAQNPREVAWPPGFWLILSVSVHWPRTLKIFMSFICQSSLLIQPSFQPVSLQEKNPWIHLPSIISKLREQEANDPVNLLFHNFQGNHRIFWNPSEFWGTAVLRNCPVTATWATRETVPPYFPSVFSRQYLADATSFLMESVPASSQGLYLLLAGHLTMHPTPKWLINIQCS